MATKETRVARGRARGTRLTMRLVNELAEARRLAGLSQDGLAAALGWSQSAVSRLERLARPEQISIVELAQAAAVLGLELSAGLHPMGEPLRDKGHQALIARFVAVLGSAWRVAREVPLPNVGDSRAWDLVLRIASCIVGVE